ncbi:DNA replication protein, phage associated protein [Neisseria gonorrhoeae]|nr:DNA replication protein, phage associated protein [Neisseria gonorrhoeae]
MPMLVLTNLTAEAFRENTGRAESGTGCGTAAAS